MPGVTKSMPAASSSSNPVSDALTNLTRAATAALTSVQERAQEDVIQARAERDEALKAFQEAQLEAKDLELREGSWRAALEKSDLTVKHQAETIAQLRNEVGQWKTQLTRLEESSRQEIEDWKEQYRRAEHERSRLSTRIDELIAGQLAWNAAAQAYVPPYTARLAYTEMPEPSTSSSGSKRASTSTHTHRPVGTPRRSARAVLDEVEEMPLPTTARKSRPAGTSGSRNVAHTDRNPASRSRGGSPVRHNAGRRNDVVSGTIPRASGSRTGPRTPAVQQSPVQVQSQPRQQIIRRVTAIVDVKEEEQSDDLEDEESVRSGSVFDPDEEASPIPPTGTRRRATNAPARRKQVVQDWDEDEQTPDVGDDAHQYDEAQDDDDDELLLGPKKGRAAAGGAKHPRASVSGKPRGPAKKRKLGTDTAAPSGRSGPAKAAKTR
ncbi:hypothetical protein BD413DRAFT_551911 [Trametes elegans]|nr:hypothetical protein BD413DRAFT_551911 [Trametes elegans]